MTATTPQQRHRFIADCVAGEDLAGECSVTVVHTRSRDYAVLWDSGRPTEMLRRVDRILLLWLMGGVTTRDDTWLVLDKMLDSVRRDAKNETC